MCLPIFSFSLECSQYGFSCFASQFRLLCFSSGILALFIRIGLLFFLDHVEVFGLFVIVSNTTFRLPKLSENYTFGLVYPCCWQVKMYERKKKVSVIENVLS